MNNTNNSLSPPLPTLRLLAKERENGKSLLPSRSLQCQKKLLIIVDEEDQCSIG